MMIGPRQMAGASRSTMNPSDISLTPYASSGIIRFSCVTCGRSKTLNIRGMLGP